MLKRFCLHPSYSLRKQLLLSFGCSAVLSLATLVVVTCVCIQLARVAVETQAEILLEEQVVDRLTNSTLFIAKAVNTYMEGIEGSAQLVSEFVRDRIVGYPHDGWEEDLHVPFLDMDTNTNKYPLKSAPLPLAMGNETDSSSLGSYFCQQEAEVQVNQTTNRGLYEKSADLAVLLKPLYEATPEAAFFAMYFHNRGSGSIVSFPGLTHSNNNLERYVSVGCDWMR